MKTNRRRVISGAAAMWAAATLRPAAATTRDDGWHSGDLAHLLPAASHERFLVKCSFRAALDFVPTLAVGRRAVAGTATGSMGRFWQFDVSGLEPDTDYTLELRGPDRRPLADAWSLRTLPAPDAEPERVRLLAFTCAGGHPLMEVGGRSVFLPLEARRRLLARALSFGPQAMIANGDHIYWDQRTWLESDNPERAQAFARLFETVGTLDRERPALGTRNEVSLQAIAGPQIAELYGTLLRSTPSYFVNDDHDYFENDEANPRFVTFPPETYQLEFARFVRNLYLPEFLPDVGRPVFLSGSNAADRPHGVSESFGTFRWGTLAEALIYDCGRFLDLKGAVAGLVPPDAERWLTRRTADERVRHLLHVPSHPFGWTAGKWREWYPDVADAGDAGDEGESTVARMGVAAGTRFELTDRREKYLWQRGWWHQHQRLLGMLSAQPKRTAIAISGDLHAVGHGLLTRSRDLDLAANPVHTILTGPLGTGTAWPSAARGTPPMTPIGLEARTISPVVERNGFTLLDFSPASVRVRLFAWSAADGIEAIDRLEPVHDYEIARR